MKRWASTRDQQAALSHFLTGSRQNGHFSGGCSVRYRREQWKHCHIVCPLGGFFPVGIGGFSSAMF